MAINIIRNTSLDRIGQKAARDTPPETSRLRAERQREGAEVARPTQPKRPPPLVSAVKQSLVQAGLTDKPAEPVPDIAAASATKVRDTTEASQAEKSAEAQQAFMHSLVKALRPETGPESTSPAAIQSVTRSSEPAEASASTAPAAASYGGLVNGLESLIQAISGDRGAISGNEDLAALESAFRHLVDVSAPNSSQQDGSIPDLQTVLKNLARNLQSTGDPTLASTGNVINTSA